VFKLTLDEDYIVIERARRLLAFDAFYRARCDEVAAQGYRELSLA
jgi:hypothetical protein